jgi:hypothetical protein
MRAEILFFWLSSLSLSLVIGYSYSSRDSRIGASRRLSDKFRDTHGWSTSKRLLFDLKTTQIKGLLSITFTLNMDTDMRPFTVTGEHSFIPPNFDAGDQRGPCPGLNALANHGYIGRNGVTSVSGKVTSSGKP